MIMSQGGDIGCQDTVSPSTRPKAVVLQRDDVVYNIFWRNIQKEAQQSRSLAHCETGSFSVFCGKTVAYLYIVLSLSIIVFCGRQCFVILNHFQLFLLNCSSRLLTLTHTHDHRCRSGELFIQIICAESLLNQGPPIGLEELLEAGHAPQTLIDHSQ